MNDSFMWPTNMILSLIGPTGGSAVGCIFFFFQLFSDGLAVEYSSCFISVLNLDLYVCNFDASMS